MIDSSKFDLKAKNQPAIVVFAITNGILLCWILLGFSAMRPLSTLVKDSVFLTIGKFVALPVLAGAIVSVFTWSVPRSWKEVAIFWRSKRNALPSCRVFSKIAPHDPRIDLALLARTHGPLPQDAVAQSKLWYPIYKKHCNDASVRDANRAYLRFREMFTIAVLQTIAAGVYVLTHAQSRRSVVSFLAVVVAEMLLLILSTRNAAQHLVTNVLAAETASVAMSTQNTRILIP